MALTEKEIKHIAHLARLGLNETEEKIFAKQLSSILDYIEQLKEVKTDDIYPTAQITGLENQFRPDVVQNCDKKIQIGLLETAPAVENNLIKANNVFE